MKDTTKVVQWNEVIEEASSISGHPKKQIEESADAIVKAVDSLLQSKQPVKRGLAVEVRTPFTNYTSTRYPEMIIDGENGQKYKRPEVCTVKCGVPKWAVIAANVGLVDDVAEKKPAKSA